MWVQVSLYTCVHTSTHSSRSQPPETCTPLCCPIKLPLRSLSAGVRKVKSENWRDLEKKQNQQIVNNLFRDYNGAELGLMVSMEQGVQALLLRGLRTVLLLRRKTEEEGRKSWCCASMGECNEHISQYTNTVISGNGTEQISESWRMWSQLLGSYSESLLGDLLQKIA